MDDGTEEDTLVDNVRQVFEHGKTQLGLDEVDYVVPSVSHQDVSFIKEKRQKKTEFQRSTYA